MSSTSDGRINLNISDALNEASELDDLLPLFRRKKFDEDIGRFCQEAIRSSSSLLMFMIDVDRFKAINDSKGHPVGDQVLVGTARVISDRVRGKGKSYRFGGEEFAVLLPNYMTVEGIALAEVIRKQIEQSVFSEMMLKVTVSIGVAGVPEHTKTPHELIEMADSAMYEAKRLGRNLVRVSGEQTPVQHNHTVERKLPMAGTLSDEDREHIRVTYFTRNHAECPKDGIPLRVLKEFHEVTKRTPSIIVLCPACGLQEIIHGLE